MLLTNAFAAHTLLNAAARIGFFQPFSLLTTHSSRRMYYGLYTSAAGANAQNHKVEVLSNNLANVNTVGFKRELAILQARDAESIERGITSRGTGSLDDVGGGVRMN